MTEFTQLSLFDVLEGLEKKDFSAVEVAEATVKAAEAAQGALNCFTFIDGAPPMKVLRVNGAPPVAKSNGS